jgi:Holin of 3TMs, for gene-transfer release
MMPWTAIIGAVGSIADDLITTDEERSKIGLAERELDQRPQLAQISANVEQAKHPSLFVAGARPGVIWVGVASLAWTYVLHPMLMWAWALAQANGWIEASMPPPPTLDTEQLMVVVTGVLGIGGMRSFDKLRGTATERLSP